MWSGVIYFYGFGRDRAERRRACSVGTSPGRGYRIDSSTSATTGCRSNEGQVILCEMYIYGVVPSGAISPEREYSQVAEACVVAVAGRDRNSQVSVVLY